MTGRPDQWIRWTTVGCVALLALIAGTRLLPSFAHVGSPARAARLGGCAYPAVSGWHDCRCIHDFASGIAVRPTGRAACVGVAGRRQRREPCRRCRRGRAGPDRPHDRGLAIIRADRVV